MKICGIVLFFVLACCVLFLSFYGKESYARVANLEKSVKWQQKENLKALRKIERLKQRVVGIQQNSRMLEKEARNALGLARPDDYIIIFDKDKVDDE